MSFLRWTILISLFASLSLTHGGQIIDFDGLFDGELVTTQYPGLVFQNAAIASAGVTLNEFEAPPHSGSNVAVDAAGAMTIFFLAPAMSFSGYFTYGARLTITAFDSSNNSLAVVTSLFDNNFALSGDPGSSSNEPLGLTLPAGMDHVLISAGAGGGTFAMDDIAIDAVPESGSLILTAIGLAIVLVFAIVSHLHLQRLSTPSVTS